VEGLAVPDPRSAPDRELLRGELAQAVRDKVAELPRVYQLVLKMRFFEGLPYQRMARALRVPVNTAKSYVHRAKAILRQKLQAYLDEPGRMS
jgi:RNA polymerase sigma-70 factor (ECF subfamily)